MEIVVNGADDMVQINMSVDEAVRLRDVLSLTPEAEDVLIDPVQHLYDALVAKLGEP